MTYTLAMLVLIEFVIIMKIYTKLRLAQETEKFYTDNSELTRTNYYQSMLDDVVNDFEKTIPKLK